MPPAGRGVTPLFSRRAAIAWRAWTRRQRCWHARGPAYLAPRWPSPASRRCGAFFQAADGGYGRVSGWVHRHEDYVAALTASGFEIRACVEPSWSEAEVPILGGPLYPLAPEALAAAFVGLPAALVWSLVRA
jgi:hypothetical protein